MRKNDELYNILYKARHISATLNYSTEIIFCNNKNVRKNAHLYNIIYKGEHISSSLKTKIIKCIRIKKGKIKSVKIKQNKSRYCYFNKKMCIYITLVKNKQ